jgi:CRISPR-associated protein Cmr6
MTGNYRRCLQSFVNTDTTHPALWLDKYLPDHEPNSKQALVEQVAKIPVSDVYEKFYTRWKVVLENNSTVVTKKATVQGRLSVGLGAESVVETAITLHRTYGVPYIPGSALKGLAAHYARNHLTPDDWGAQSKYYQIMFGDVASAGYVTFFDALYVPGTGHERRPLWPDIITVHHPQYYQSNEAPADWDSPTPISFLSATGDYLFAIAGESAWVEKAYEILALALHDEGIGAKTSSGYGRMTIAGMKTPIPVQSLSAMTQAVEPVSVRETRQGIIVDIQPPKRRGRVRDQASGKEYNFETSVIVGNTPPKKAIVIFEVEGGNKVTKVQRK